MKKIYLIVLVLYSLSCLGADDYILGQYEHIDKLQITNDMWDGEVVGEGKYVAGFIETFYDNISENYRKNPILRQKVLKQMRQAEKEGRKEFFLSKDEYLKAFQVTTGPSFSEPDPSRDGGT